MRIASSFFPALTIIKIPAFTYRVTTENGYKNKYAYELNIHQQTGAVKIRLINIDRNITAIIPQHNNHGKDCIPQAIESKDDQSADSPDMSAIVKQT